MKILLTFFALFMLSGCASGHWVLPGASPQQASMMAYDCQYMANMQAKGSGYMTSVIAQDQFDACMQSRGFIFVMDQQPKQSKPTVLQTSPVPYQPGRTYSLHERTRIYEAWNEAKKNGKTLSAEEVEEVRKKASAEEAEQDAERMESLKEQTPQK